MLQAGLNSDSRRIFMRKRWLAHSAMAVCETKSSRKREEQAPESDRSEEERSGRDKGRVEEKHNDETNESWRHLHAAWPTDDFEPHGIWRDATCRSAGVGTAA